MVDQVGPAGGGVTGPDLGVAGQVGAQPFGEVALAPGAGEPGLVVIGGELVDVHHPVARHRAEVPLRGLGFLAPDLGVAGVQGGGDLSDQGGHG